MAEPKRNIKDSLFTFLFSQPEYTQELYLALHPEDKDIKKEDLKLITLENVLAIGQYNDLGIQVRDKLILLMEAQSTFSHNIPLRMLMYLANTYKEYVEENHLSLYQSRPVTIPRPELYVIYTGDVKNTPETLRLSSLYEGSGSVEVEVKVLRKGNNGDIVEQYIEFCEILKEQVKIHGRTEEALRNTIKICLERGILAPFLSSRMKEVVDIMEALFDQEKVWEIERYNIRKEGLEEGREEGLRELINKMLTNASILEVSRITGYSEEEINQILKI